MIYIYIQSDSLYLIAQTNIIYTIAKLLNRPRVTYKSVAKHAHNNLTKLVIHKSTKTMPRFKGIKKNKIVHDSESKNMPTK